MKRFLSVNLILLLSLVMVLSIFAPVSVGAVSGTLTEAYNFNFDTTGDYNEFLTKFEAKSGSVLTYNEGGYAEFQTSKGKYLDSTGKSLFALENGKYYNVRFKVKANVSATLGLQVCYPTGLGWSDYVHTNVSGNEGGNGYADFMGVAVTDTWKEVNYIFKFTGTTNNTNFFFYTTSDNAVTFCLDDFYMSEIEQPMEICSYNFDTDSDYSKFLNWANEGTESKTERDENALKVTLNTASVQGRIYSGTIAWEKNVNYSISFDMKGDGCQVGLYTNTGGSFNRIENGQSQTGDLSKTYTTTSDWKSYNVSFTYTGDAKNTSVFFYFPQKTKDKYYYLDNLVIKKYYTITNDISKGGSVTINGENASASKDVAPGSSVEIAVTPDNGYAVGTVKYGETDLVLNAEGKVTLPVNVSDTLTVTFTQRAVVAPSITLTEGTGDAEGIYVYADINDYYAPDFDLSEYGVNIWKTEDSANKIALKSMAGFAPNTKVGFRVYGSAITAGQSFTFKPYMSGFTKLFGSDFGENYVYSDVLKYNTLTTENGALKVTNPENKNTVYYLKNVDWIPGKTYRVSFRLKGDSSSPKMNLTVNGAYPAFTKEIIGVNTTRANNFTALASGLVPTEEWKDYSVTFKYTGTEEKTHDIYFSFDRSGSSPNYSYAQGTYYIDDLVVEETAVAQEIGEELLVTCK